jgi:GxxExxY protein
VESAEIKTLKKELPADIESVSRLVIGKAIDVHRELGPGLLECIYEDALVYELGQTGVEVWQQVEVPVRYKDTVLRAQRFDLIIGRCIVVELKSVLTVNDIWRAQLLSYLRATGLPLGLLLNFNVRLLKDGLERVYNERSRSPFRLDPTFAPSASSSRPSR